MMEIYGLSASFFLGVLASLFVWWITTHYLKPNILFSEEVAEYILSNEESFFQCAFQNIGKRDIVDLEIYVRISIFRYKGATGWASHIVKSNASRVPLLSPNKNRRVRIFDSRDQIEFLDVPSKSIRTEIEKCRSLRNILTLGDDATVRVHVFGYDALGGSRKHFQSKEYRRRDIRKGTFNNLNVVENTRFKRD